MSALGDMRRELADDLAGPAPTSLTVYDHVPGRVLLPAAMVMPGSPYVEQGQTFGARTVRFDVVLLSHPSLNSETTEQVDVEIEAVTRRLMAAGWDVERVLQPQIYDFSNGEALGVAISVATQAAPF